MEADDHFDHINLSDDLNYVDRLRRGLDDGRSGEMVRESEGDSEQADRVVEMQEERQEEGGWDGRIDGGWMLGTGTRERNTGEESREGGT